MAYNIIRCFTDISGATRYLVELERDRCIYLKFKGKISEEDIQKAADIFVLNENAIMEQEAILASKQMITLKTEIPKIGDTCPLCSQKIVDPKEE